MSWHLWRSQVYAHYCVVYYWSKVGLMRWFLARIWNNDSTGSGTYRSILHNKKTACWKVSIFFQTSATPQIVSLCRGSVTTPCPHNTMPLSREHTPTQCEWTFLTCLKIYASIQWHVFVENCVATYNSPHTAILSIIVAYGSASWDIKEKPQLYEGDMQNMGTKLFPVEDVWLIYTRAFQYSYQCTSRGEEMIIYSVKMSAHQIDSFSVLLSFTPMSGDMHIIDDRPDKVNVWLGTWGTVRGYKSYDSSKWKTSCYGLVMLAYYLTLIQ